VEDGLLGPAQVRDLAVRLGIRPTKTLGQNFVVDPNTVRRIVRIAGVDATDVVLEVGPGLGSLTLALLGVADRVTAVEIDPALADQLPLTVADRLPERAGRLRVIEADALRIQALPDPQPSAVVANLPYNVAVPVLLTLLERLPTLSTGLVMVQAEVAERLAAAPGSRTYGVPSVKLAWYAEARRAGAVGRAVFWPQPNVESGLVAFTRRQPPPTTATREQVFAVIDAAFAQRRKMLRSALAGWAGSSAAAQALLTAAGVPGTARGEELDVTRFAAIAGVAADRSAGHGGAATGSASRAT
jgi:16S rRNA (adenine1518-N6/adenine1519-N6)-dimethyltransferase